MTGWVGVSLRDNVSEGIAPFSRFQHNLGPIRISIGSRNSNGGFPIQGYALPISAIYLISGFVSKHDKLDWRRTLSNGVFVFNSKPRSWKVSDPQYDVLGSVMGNNIFMNDIVRNGPNGMLYEIVLGHEMVHILQYREMSSLSGLLDQIPSFKLGKMRLQPFKDFKYRLRWDVGNDVSWWFATGMFYPLPHPRRPIEYIPLTLELNI